jgi:hypothetical protein
MSGVALGFRAIRGGAVAVAVAVEDGAPRVVLSAFLATAAEGDRLAFEPYHVAVEEARGPRGMGGATAALAEGRKRQDAAATKGLDDLIRRLDTGRPAVAALLVNRAGWITDLLEHSLSAPEHPPVAEGLAVRDALRSAFSHCGLAVVEMDEKSLPETASARLGLGPGAIEHRLKDLGAGAKPWRKEQKLAALAAWVAAL